MLYLIGLGLADEKDITVKGLEIVKRAERVYLEAYTSILHCGKDKLVCLLTLCSATAHLLTVLRLTVKVGIILWP
jgi:diphthamide biosynthesis methyltransferase